MPSHQVANDNETWQERVDRRGNGVADLIADKGRARHDLTKQLTAKLKEDEDTVKEYLKWTAFAAAAQHNEGMPADHDKRDGPRKQRTRKQHINVPQDQKILNRMPFAKTSQGLAVVHGPARRPNTYAY